MAIFYGASLDECIEALNMKYLSKDNALIGMKVRFIYADSQYASRYKKVATITYVSNFLIGIKWDDGYYRGSPSFYYNEHGKLDSCPLWEIVNDTVDIVNDTDAVSVKASCKDKECPTCSRANPSTYMVCWWCGNKS
jgi:hypothetical protein